MSISTPRATGPRSPLDTGRRALAPDLARGFMLLAIALAHTPLMVSRADHGPDWLNKVAEFVNHLMVTNQARPLFVFLFGYGLAQLTLRQQARGAQWPSIRALLRRRGFWLLVIGFAHGVLLVPLDVVAPYGLALLACAGLVRAKDSTLLWTAGLAFIPASAVATVGLVVTEIYPVGPGSLLGPTMQDDPISATLANLAAWPFGAVIAMLMVFPGMLLGVWAARRGVLDEPWRHASALRRVTLVLLGLALITRLPAALEFSGLWRGLPESAAVAMAVVQPITGYFGGIALATLIAWITIRLRSAPGRFSGALAALGQRSLTFYVFQSVAFVALFYPFTLGLRDNLGFAAASAVAVAIWVMSVLLAELMRRYGYRGPLEKLLRKATYRRKAAAEG